MLIDPDLTFMNSTECHEPKITASNAVQKENFEEVNRLKKQSLLKNVNV